MFEIYKPLCHQIVRIDTGMMQQGFAACYVMESDGEYAIVETGTHNTVAIIMEYFRNNAVELNRVKYVIPTHVHLDHAGGAGGLMQRLPQATLLIHPRGARHMIDPQKLKAGATAVYGEEAFAKTYGDVIPIEEARVQIMEDQSHVLLGKRRLVFLDTPGHAKHHFCVWDEQSKGIFSGDTFGIAYPSLQTEKGPFIYPTTTPVQFDPEALKESIQRLIQLQPERIFLTHYGQVENPQPLAHRLLSLIDHWVEKAIAISEAYDVSEWEIQLRDFLKAHLLEESERHGCALSEAERLEILSMDIDLNSQGLNVWLNNR